MDFKSFFVISDEKLAEEKCEIDDKNDGKKCGNGFSQIHVNYTCKYRCNANENGFCLQCFNDMVNNNCEKCESPASPSCENCGIILRSCYKPCYEGIIPISGLRYCIVIIIVCI